MQPKLSPTAHSRSLRPYFRSCMRNLRHESVHVSTPCIFSITLQIPSPIGCCRRPNIGFANDTNIYLPPFQFFTPFPHHEPSPDHSTSDVLRDAVLTLNLSRDPPTNPSSHMDRAQKQSSRPNSSPRRDSSPHVVHSSIGSPYTTEPLVDAEFLPRSRYRCCGHVGGRACWRGKRSTLSTSDGTLTNISKLFRRHIRCPVDG